MTNTDNGFMPITESPSEANKKMPLAAGTTWDMEFVQILQSWMAGRHEKRRRNALAKWDEFCVSTQSPTLCSNETVKKFMEYLRGQEYRGKTIGVFIHILSTLYNRLLRNEIYREKMHGNNPFLEIQQTDEFKNVFSGDAPRGRALSEDEVRKIWDYIGEYPYAKRRLLMQVAFVMELLLGQRVGATTKMKWQDLDWEAGTIKYQEKGRQWRVMAIPPDAVVYFQDLWKYTEPKPAPTDCIVDKNETTLWRWLNEAAKSTGVMHFSPHDLRRTFATKAFQEGCDIFTIKTIMGHKKVETTEVYLKNAIRLDPTKFPRAMADAMFRKQEKSVERKERKLEKEKDNVGRDGKRDVESEKGDAAERPAAEAGAQASPDSAGTLPDTGGWLVGD